MNKFILRNRVSRARRVISSTLLSLPVGIAAAILKNEIEVGKGMVQDAARAGIDQAIDLPADWPGTHDEYRAHIWAGRTLLMATGARVYLYITKSVSPFWSPLHLQAIRAEADACILSFDAESDPARHADVLASMKQIYEESEATGEFISPFSIIAHQRSEQQKSSLPPAVKEGDLPC